MPEPTLTNALVGAVVLLGFIGGCAVAALLRALIRHSWPKPEKPIDVRLVMSAEFGGGWAFADTGTGRDALAEFYCEPPHALYPFGGEQGYIVEPREARELLEHLKAEGCRMRVS